MPTQSSTLSDAPTLTLFSGQAVHLVDTPVSSLYVPAWQFTQDPELLPERVHPLSIKPAPQLLQSLQEVEVLVSPLYWPLSQATHESAEKEESYRRTPAPHSLVQLPPSGPDHPSLHTQSVRASLPLAPPVLVLEAHGEHDPALSMAALKLSTAQAVHDFPVPKKPALQAQL